MIRNNSYYANSSISYTYQNAISKVMIKRSDLIKRSDCVIALGDNFYMSKVYNRSIMEFNFQRCICP